MSIRAILSENFKTLKALHPALSKLPEITAAGGGSNGMLGRIQKGKTGVSIDALEPLAAVYGLEPWQLIAADLGRNIKKDGAKQPLLQVLIDMFNDLPNDETVRAVAFAKLTKVLYEVSQPESEPPSEQEQPAKLKKQSV